MRVSVSAVVLAASGCILKTDIVGAAFNGGALDSAADPFRIPADLAASRVERVVEQELTDGYFRQGSTGEVSAWLSAAATHVGDFAGLVKELNRPQHGAAGAPDADDGASAVKKRSDTIVSAWTGARDPICKPGDGHSAADPKALELFLDEMRFQEATWRAARRVAGLELEGLVDDGAVRRGAELAFQRAATYVHNRQWARREQQKAVGLAIEGGAASGIFSAGSVWVVLNLIDAWMTKPCPPGDTACAASKDVRFRLISGTSTGAMVAVAVDRFNSMTSHTGRAKEINNVARWFTCFSFTDLMCIQSKGIQSLVASGPGAIQGVLRFDGIQKVMTSCVKPWMFSNLSELILNTTEFRSGRIFALSDQNELQNPNELIHAALASALLPIIGDPDRQVWDHVSFDPVYDPSALERTEPVYLDGGIRSELPILPLVRRGAERVLAVASGASAITEVKRLQTAIDIAGRYINVNTGAVTETELEYAQRVAESARQAETDACMSALDKNPVCDGKISDHQPNPAYCNRWNVCHGDLANACTFIDDKKSYEDKRADEDKKTLAERLEPYWKMESIFVDQSSVDGLSGYDFQPSELRRLFRAGAEAARVRCLDLARLLGILPERGVIPPDQLAVVNTWCAARLDSSEKVCGRPTASSTEFVARDCASPITPATLDALDACKNDQGPQ